MARNPGPTNEIIEMVIAAVRSVTGRNTISLYAKLDDFDPDADRRALFEAIRNALSDRNLDAFLSFAAFSAARTIRDVVNVITKLSSDSSAYKHKGAIRPKPSFDVKEDFEIDRGEGGTAGGDLSIKDVSSDGGSKPLRSRRRSFPLRESTQEAESRSSAKGGLISDIGPWPEPAEKRAKPLMRDAATNGAPSVTAPPLAPLPDTERQISVWIGAGEERLKRTLKIGETYLLNFKVGSPVEGNLAAGPGTAVPASDIPRGGLQTKWLVMAQDAELAVGTPDTTVNDQMIGGVQTWSGRFALLIPEAGDSAVPHLRIKPLKADPRIEVVVTVRGENYRQFRIALAAAADAQPKPAEPARVEDQQMPTPTGHVGLRTTHEWTTPAGTLNITVAGGQAIVLGEVGGNYIDSIETWDGLQSVVAGPIKNVRDAAEQLRAAWENHFDDIDPIDLANRLARWNKPPEYWGVPDHNWSILKFHADAAHEQEWSRMATSAELRKLAQHGRSLFRAFFPNGSNLRTWLEALLPGARLNISWTRKGGPGFIPHVPWGLMYLADVPPDGQPIDPMGFLGMRCRVAYNAHPVQAASRSLGALNETHRAHFLYWGDGATDVTGQEAQWQRTQWGGWQNQVFVPQSAQNAKAELLQLLNDPKPSPTSVLYLFCQCSTGAGNNPVLRFGDTNDIANMVAQTDFGTSAWADRPLVFANACTTAAADPYMANELEQAFFERECRAYLGTETKVPIVFGSRFAAIFFHFFYRILDPDPMAAGEAVTQTRLFLWTHYRNIGGLFYTYVNQYDLYLARDDEVRSLRR